MEKPVLDKRIEVLSHLKSNVEGFKELLRNWQVFPGIQWKMCLSGDSRERLRDQDREPHGKEQTLWSAGDKGFAPGGPGTTQMNQLSVISKGIMSRKANDWAEIRNPGAEGGGRPLQGEVECQGMFGASQKGAASQGGKSCVKGTIVESSKTAGLQENYRRAPDEKAAAVAWLLC